MKKFFSRDTFITAKTYIIAHKIISGIGLVVIIFLGYTGYAKLTSASGEKRYVLATVARDTIISSVTASGQVSASNQVDLKPKVTGDIVYVGVVDGQKVKAGTLIAQIDSQDAQKAVRDAQVNLQSSQLSLQKLQQPADTLSVTQSQDTLARAQESKQNSQDDLNKAYEDGFNEVSNSFLDLPSVMAGLQDVLYSNNPGLGGNNQWNIDFYTNTAVQYDPQATAFENDTNQKYKIARAAYDKNFQDYKSTDRTSDPAVIAALIDEAYQTAKSIADAVKSSNNLIQFYEDKLTQNNHKPASAADTQLATLNTYTGKTNTHVTNLLAAKTTISNDQTAIVNADRTITENTQSLAKLNAGTDPLDLQSAQLSVTQRQNALQDAQAQYADYFIRAPFDGTVAKMDSLKGDNVSSGTVVATVITDQKVADVTLNEVDVAKIKTGDKVTLTFDAISDLSISGQVLEIDNLGTVSQGVVTYGVKIGFDTQDDRVKPGMSVSAAIITDVKPNVISVPNSAIKTSGTTQYVEVFDTPPVQTTTTGTQSLGVASAVAPRQVVVETGVSNDTSTEIVSGLKEGDTIVTRTIAATTGTTAARTTTPSLLGSVGAGGAARATGGFRGN